MTADIDSKVEGLHRLKFTPDGKTVCVVSVKTGELLFFDAQSLKLEQNLTVGHGAGLYMDEQSGRLFVSCTSDNYVSVIRLSDRSELMRIAVSRPDGVISVISD